MPIALLTPGIPQLLIVLVVVLVVFGPKRLPALGRQLGDGLRQLRKTIDEHDEADEDAKAGSAEAAAKPVERAPADPTVPRPVADEETVTAEPVDAPRRRPRD